MYGTTPEPAGIFFFFFAREVEKNSFYNKYSRV
jgi:hypothetical protein